ncbi:MAG: LamG-like jellyroll fold domain-containing protein [Candidatus Saccharimonadales bacterium]
MHKSTTGFTIVELLIVIIVIGILASITIVAYNGIVDKAHLAAGLSFERQIKNKYLLDATGEWSLDTCTGSTIQNTGATPSTDVILGTANWITDTPSQTGCALRLDGATRIETQQAPLGSTYYVKAAWVRIPKGPCSSSSNNIISQATNSGSEAALYAPSCKPAAGHNGTWSMVTSPAAINDGKWHYIAVIWEQNIPTLYVDGKNVASASGIGVPTRSTGGVSIGAYLNSYHLIGDIDNIFVAAQ